MFDNLREEPPDESPASFFEEEASELFPDADAVSPVPTFSPSGTSGTLLGMTGIQRFIIVMMFMIAVITLGFLCLLVTGKIGLG